jgi:hypothetical protein
MKYDTLTVTSEAIVVQFDDHRACDRAPPLCKICRTFHLPPGQTLCSQCAIHKEIHRLDIERARLVKLLKKERGTSR